jgi:GTPase SAR1 family protein
MTVHKPIKKEILDINQNLKRLIEDAKEIPGSTGQCFDDWIEACGRIKQQITEDKLRIAVVGPIKSGKSTFLNALFQADYLKRGAGVITSIVTRINQGPALKAELHFKSLAEINRDISQAMILFPSSGPQPNPDEFNILDDEKRLNLQTALDQLNPELLITNDVRNINSILLASYLKGFERVQPIITSQTLIRTYDQDHFFEHMDFAGNDHLAVYLKDITLEINTRRLDQGVEIADCQGSDSPNPMHLAMIQDYLALSHLLVYVISSRTGLRQADIKFLSMIKKMGIMDNTLFVFNCDLSEHDAVTDLKHLTEKLTEELAILKPDPEIYAFSTLFNLFRAQRHHLSPKDLHRFDQWSHQEDLALFSDTETLRFDNALAHRLDGERYALLLKNNLERLGAISSGLGNRISINHDILNRSTADVTALNRKIESHRQGIDAVKSMIRSTLDGALQRIKSELRKDVDQFFDERSGDILTEILEFISHYTVPAAQYEENLKSGGFSNTMYMTFQEFKQALDTFIAESVIPRIFRFVKQEEEKIITQLNAVAGPFEAMVENALSEYTTALAGVGISLKSEGHVGIRLLDMDAIKTETGMTLPPLVAAMRYSARIKTEAMMRLGAYSFIGLFRKILKKSTKPNRAQAINALKDSSRQMKRETRRSVRFHFKDYRENLKFQYIFKLLDASAKDIYDALFDRFRGYATDLSQTAELMGQEKIDRHQASTLLTKMQQDVNSIQTGIDQARERIEAL